MTYRGTPGNNKKLGIKPTEADRKFVHYLARIGLGVRRISVLMGERYHLQKPMSRMALYYHFRNELKRTKAPATRNLHWYPMMDVLADMDKLCRARRSKK